MQISVLQKKINSLPEADVEKVSEYVDFLLRNLSAGSKANAEKSAAERKAALANMEKYRGRLRLPPDFDYKRELETALREKHGHIS